MAEKEYKLIDCLGDIHLKYGDEEFLVWGCESDSIHMTADDVISAVEARGWPAMPEDILEKLG
jgi:hypothetical protein